MIEQLPELVIDKSTWGDGPWQSEPDRVDFVAHGFACMILRHPHNGQLCGYVGVPREHPAYGKKYDDVDVEVHGGLTYARECQDGICHVPEPGMPDDVWWLGFDCAHAFDFAPGVEATLKVAHEFMKKAHPDLAARSEELNERMEQLVRESPYMRKVYRDVAYVRAEAERLAAQLAEMGRA